MNSNSISKEPNCLNLIRIAAAFQVMFGHTITHLKVPINQTLFRATYFLRGVPIFFAMSGLLIWLSVGRSKSYRQFLTKRFLRIFPELWVSVLADILVIMALYRGWTAKSLILFGIGQGTVLQFWTPSALHGYGVGTPNGALWTMGVIIQFYIVVWFFYKIMKGCSIGQWLIGFAASFIISFGTDRFFHNIVGGTIANLYEQTIVRYFWIFYIGMFIAEFGNTLLPVLKKYWWAFLTAAFVFFWSGVDIISGYYLFWSLFLVFGLTGFAYRYPNIYRFTDISYGVFLYHMIVVNAFVTFGLTGKWSFAICSGALSLLLAYLSTVVVGKWAAGIKRKLT